MSVNRRDFIKGSIVITGGLLLPAHLIGCQRGEYDTEFDVVVYGGTSAGVIAAVQVVKMGKSVVLVSPDKQLGGLTSGGLGWTDTGDRSVIGGLSKEFYHRVWKHYQSRDAWSWQTREEFNTDQGQGGTAFNEEEETAWVFEPSVAEKIYDEFIEEYNIKLDRDEWLDRSRGVEIRNGRIRSITTLSGKNYRGKVFIDATYEGDLLATAGVSYTTGREPNSMYGETINGIQAGRNTNQMPWGVDPYIEAGNPDSGVILWPPINSGPGGENGEGDHRVQAYCFRMCLTNVKGNLVPIDKPDGYVEKDFELLFRSIEAGQSTRFYKFSPLPNFKTDSNNDSGMSTNLIGRNYDYPDGSYERRREIIEEQKYWQQGMAWSLRNHPRVPEKLREEHSRWGLASDEFLQTSHWPHQIYVRVGRRMVGDLVVNENHLRLIDPTHRSVGMGSYNMDSHNVQRHIVYDAAGKPHVRAEGDVQVHPGAPYPIDYGSIIPKKQECVNLIVPVAVSSSHIAFGSIRMEPVFMILGQSAATAAVMAIETNQAVQDLSFENLKNQLIKDGQILQKS
jgi:hypothetical protein